MPASRRRRVLLLDPGFSFPAALATELERIGIELSHAVRDAEAALTIAPYRNDANPLSLESIDLDCFGPQIRRCDPTGVLLHLPSPSPVAFELGQHAAWRRELQRRLSAPFFALRACSPQLRRHDGAVVVLLEAPPLRPEPEEVVARVVHNAALALCRSLALELHPDVRVNALVTAFSDPSHAEMAARAATLASLLEAREISGEVLRTRRLKGDIEPT